MSYKWLRCCIKTHISSYLLLLSIPGTTIAWCWYVCLWSKWLSLYIKSSIALMLLLLLLLLLLIWIHIRLIMSMLLLLPMRLILLIVILLIIVILMHLVILILIHHIWALTMRCDWGPLIMFLMNVGLGLLLLLKSCLMTLITICLLYICILIWYKTHWVIAKWSI